MQLFDVSALKLDSRDHPCSGAGGNSIMFVRNTDQVT
jgi:hypothetical protein